MLTEIFAVAGPVAQAKIIPDRNFQHGGLNYGFVEYSDIRAAEQALQTLNGRKIFDTEIRVNWAYQNTNTNATAGGVLQGSIGGMQGGGMGIPVQAGGVGVGAGAGAGFAAAPMMMGVGASAGPQLQFQPQSIIPGPSSHSGAAGGGGGGGGVKEDTHNHFHVFVGDLSPEVNDEALTKAFGAFPTMSEARVMWDMNSGKSRGYGFLAFR